MNNNSKEGACMHGQSRARKVVCVLATLTLAAFCLDVIGANGLRSPQRRRERRYQ